jgi:hypothetical protein
MTIDSTIELELRVSLDRLQQMLQPVLHLRFADAGRTVAAPAGAAELAAKCNDVPSTRIPRDAASQSLPAPHPPLPLSLSSTSPAAVPRRIQRRARAPRCDDVLPTISFPGGQGCSAPSDRPTRFGRRERSSLGAAEIPVLHGEGASSTREHDGARGRGASSSLGAGAKQRSGVPAGEARRRRPLADRARAGDGGIWRVELGRHLSPSPLGPAAPWRSEVGPTVADSFTPVGRLLPHSAVVFFPVVASPPLLPPSAGANGQGSMQQLLRDAAGGTPPLLCLHPLSLFLNRRCRGGIRWRRS